MVGDGALTGFDFAYLGTSRHSGAMKSVLVLGGSIDATDKHLGAS